MSQLPKLPKCPLDGRAFPSDVRESIGGWFRLAGFDLEETLPKSVKDHPWIGCTVTFPCFAENGWFSNGKIVRCIVHPLGRLMFDIEWPVRCPPIQGGGYRGEVGWEVVLKEPPEWAEQDRDKYGYLYHDKEQRYFADEIVELTKDKPQRKLVKTNG